MVEVLSEGQTLPLGKLAPGLNRTSAPLKPPSSMESRTHAEGAPALGTMKNATNAQQQAQDDQGHGTNMPVHGDQNMLPTTCTDPEPAKVAVKPPVDPQAGAGPPAHNVQGPTVFHIPAAVVMDIPASTSVPAPMTAMAELLQAKTEAATARQQAAEAQRLLRETRAQLSAMTLEADAAKQEAQVAMMDSGQVRRSNAVLHARIRELEAQVASLKEQASTHESTQKQELLKLEQTLTADKQNVQSELEAMRLRCNALSELAAKDAETIKMLSKQAQALRDTKGHSGAPAENGNTPQAEAVVPLTALEEVKTSMHKEVALAAQLIVSLRDELHKLKQQHTQQIQGLTDAWAVEKAKLTATLQQVGVMSNSQAVLAERRQKALQQQVQQMKAQLAISEAARLAANQPSLDPAHQLAALLGRKPTHPPLPASLHSLETLSNQSSAGRAAPSGSQLQQPQLSKRLSDANNASSPAPPVQPPSPAAAQPPAAAASQLPTVAGRKVLQDPSFAVPGRPQSAKQPLTLAVPAAEQLAQPAEAAGRDPVPVPAPDTAPLQLPALGALHPPLPPQPAAELPQGPATQEAAAAAAPAAAAAAPAPPVDMNKLYALIQALEQPAGVSSSSQRSPRAANHTPGPTGSTGTAADGDRGSKNSVLGKRGSGGRGANADRQASLHSLPPSIPSVAPAKTESSLHLLAAAASLSMECDTPTAVELPPAEELQRDRAARAEELKQRQTQAMLRRAASGTGGVELAGDVGAKQPGRTGQGQVPVPGRLPDSSAPPPPVPDVALLPLPTATHEQVLASTRVFESCLANVHRSLGIKHRLFNAGDRKLLHYDMYRNVCVLGGYETVSHNARSWKHLLSTLKIDARKSEELKEWYTEQLWPMEQVYYSHRSDHLQDSRLPGDAGNGYATKLTADAPLPTPFLAPAAIKRAPSDALHADAPAAKRLNSMLAQSSGALPALPHAPRQHSTNMGPPPRAGSAVTNAGSGQLPLFPADATDAQQPRPGSQELLTEVISSTIIPALPSAALPNLPSALGAAANMPGTMYHIPHTQDASGQDKPGPPLVLSVPGFELPSTDEVFGRMGSTASSTGTFLGAFSPAGGASHGMVGGTPVYIMPAGGGMGDVPVMSFTLPQGVVPMGVMPMVDGNGRPVQIIGGTVEGGAGAGGGQKVVSSVAAVLAGLH